LLLDYATLTGSCVTALGTRYSGAFCNREDLIRPVLEAGRNSGERVWPLPVDADYDQDIESSIADVKQCATEGDADHILAARFPVAFRSGIRSMDSHGPVRIRTQGRAGAHPR